MDQIKPRKKHLGRNIAKIREFRGIKQETLADVLGITQPSVAKMESEETVSDERLEKVAEALGVTPEVIRNFDVDRVFYYINTVQSNSVGVVNGDCIFNSGDKVAEIYERLIKSEQEKIELLKRLKNS